MTSPITELIAFTIDCSDAAALAHFYADLSGGEVGFVSEEYGYAQATVAGATINFQQVAGYAAPQWPSQEHPQQFHLDFRVADLDAAAARAEELGAKQASEQPGGEAYRVMTDPDGHPFCLCPPSGDSA